MKRFSEPLAVRVAARRALAARLLTEGEDAEEVLLAAEVSVGVLIQWCFDPDGGLLVPEEIAEDLAHRADDASRRWRETTSRQRANASGRLRDTDRAYRHLEEEVTALKREYREFNSEAYTPGWDDEIDEKEGLLRHWYG